MTTKSFATHDVTVLEVDVAVRYRRALSMTQKPLSAYGIGPSLHTRHMRSHSVAALRDQETGQDARREDKDDE